VAVGARAHGRGGIGGGGGDGGGARLDGTIAEHASVHKQGMKSVLQSIHDRVVSVLAQPDLGTLDVAREVLRHSIVVDNNHVPGGVVVVVVGEVG
jgi:hypothetical protein